MLAAGLSADGFDVQVAALKSGPAMADFRRAGIEPNIIGRHWSTDPISIWKLRNLISRLQPDIVHTWLFDANTHGRLAALWAGSHGLVATERHIGRWKTDVEHAIDRCLARPTGRIIVPSGAVKQFYRRHGVPGEMLMAIPSGVYVDSKLPAANRGTLLGKLELPADAKLIAYVGPILRRKRLKEIIWAADQLKAVGVQAHLLMIGEGADRAALERYAWLNRVNDRVHFLGSRDNVPQLLAVVDVLWQPSATEGMSIAILEGMAAGIPVVAADAGGNRELISSGETGQLVSVGERAGFARCTLQLLEDPTLAHQLGEAGRKLVTEHYRPADFIARHAAIYRELLAGC